MHNVVEMVVRLWGLGGKKENNDGITIVEQQCPQFIISASGGETASIHLGQPSQLSLQLLNHKLMCDKIRNSFSFRYL